MNGQVKQYCGTDNRYMDEADGCATAWNTSVFKLITEKIFHLELTTVGSKPVVIVTTLFHLASQTKINVINTHLSSGYQQKEALRVAEMTQILLDTVDFWQHEHCIIVGDMNSDALTAYGKATNPLSLTYLMQQKHHFHNALHGARNYQRSLVTYNDHQPSWFDQVWITPTLYVVNGMISNVETVPNGPPMRLPNIAAGLGSDHLPIYVSMAVK
jgi:endonuclease/exonuclease/phosphatase family metal-dependent hydrolase